MKGSEGLIRDPTCLSCNVFCHLFLTNFVLAGNVALYCWLCIEAAGSLFFSFSLYLISLPNLPCFLESAWDSFSPEQAQLFGHWSVCLKPQLKQGKKNKNLQELVPFSFLPQQLSVITYMYVTSVPQKARS